jgi:hypothetical protein
MVEFFFTCAGDFFAITVLLFSFLLIRYNDGSVIPDVSDNIAWRQLTAGAYCWYNNDLINKNTYSALYNSYTFLVFLLHRALPLLVFCQGIILKFTYGFQMKTHIVIPEQK